MSFANLGIPQINLFDSIRVQLLQHDRDLICAINGQRGSGKSCAGMTMGLKCAEEMNTYFWLENIFFSTKDFMTALKEKRLRNGERIKKGTAFLYEEVETSANARDWRSKHTKSLNDIFTTIRPMNLILFSTWLTFNHVDKQLRSKYRALINCIPAGINRRDKTNKVRFFWLEHKKDFKDRDKVFRYSHWSENQKINPLIVQVPPKKLEKAYKKLRQEYVDSLIEKGLIKIDIVKKEDLAKNKTTKEMIDEIKATPTLFSNKKGKIQALDVKMHFNISFNQATIISKYMNGVVNK